MMDLFSKTTFIHAVFCLHQKPKLPIIGNCKDSVARVMGLQIISCSHGFLIIHASCSNHPCGVVDKTCHPQAQGFKLLAQFSKFAQEDLEERSFFFLHTSLDVFVPAYTAI